MLLCSPKWQKILGFVFSAVLVVSVAACGVATPSTPKTESPSASAKPSEAAKPSASESAKPSASAPASKEPMKVGVILTLTGPTGSVGTKDLAGVEMAVEEINAAGGIMGRKIELIQRDDGGDPTKARTAAEELVEKNKVEFIVGPTITSPAQAAATFLTDAKVVNITSGTGDAATDPTKFPYAFTNGLWASEQGQPIARYAVDIIKTNKVGIVAEAGAYGIASTDGYKAGLKAKGLEPVGIQQFTTGATDMSGQLNALKRAGAEAVLLASTGADSARVLKTFQAIGWDVPVLGNVDLTSAAVVDVVGPEGMKNVYALGYERMAFSDKKPINPKTKAFADKLAKRMNLPALKDAFTFEAQYYDTVYVLKMAIEKAGTTEGPKLAAALEQVKDWDGVYASWSYSKTRHCALEPDDQVMVKASSGKAGFFELAPGY
ncbi:MAG: hypothetical protein EPO21_18180 [Chloroflexota bacterium]|nr:MAG: hypothetical protein EPO21_18180 [Chloroflexota bacterium]